MIFGVTFSKDFPSTSKKMFLVVSWSLTKHHWKRCQNLPKPKDFSRTLYPLENEHDNWTITIFNRRYIFKWLFVHCHIGFQGCNSCFGCTCFSQDMYHPTASRDALRSSILGAFLKLLSWMSFNDTSYSYNIELLNTQHSFLLRTSMPKFVGDSRSLAIYLYYIYIIPLEISSTKWEGTCPA